MDYSLVLATGEAEERRQAIDVITRGMSQQRQGGPAFVALGKNWDDELSPSDESLWEMIIAPMYPQIYDSARKNPSEFESYLLVNTDTQQIIGHAQINYAHVAPKFKPKKKDKKHSIKTDSSNDSDNEDKKRLQKLVKDIMKRFIVELRFGAIIRMMYFKFWYINNLSTLVENILNESCDININGGYYELDNVVIDPNYQGKGLGKKLSQMMINRIIENYTKNTNINSISSKGNSSVANTDDMPVIYITAAENAIGFWKKRGFVECMQFKRKWFNLNESVWHHLFYHPNKEILENKYLKPISNAISNNKNNYGRSMDIYGSFIIDYPWKIRFKNDGYWIIRFAQWKYLMKKTITNKNCLFITAVGVVWYFELHKNENVIGFIKDIKELIMKTWTKVIGME